MRGIPHRICNKGSSHISSNMASKYLLTASLLYLFYNKRYFFHCLFFREMSIPRAGVLAYSMQITGKGEDSGTRAI